MPKQTKTSQLQTVEEFSLSADKVAIINSAEVIGAIKLANKMVDALGAQTIRALETFQANEMYQAYGYETFADFLDKCPNAPMTRNQYYERKKLLDAEGDAEFDVLNSLKIPARTRKLLKAGDVALDGDQLIVGDKSAPLSDAKAVRKIIAQAVEQFERLETKSDKNEKEIEKLKKRLDEAREQAANAAPVAADLGDDADLAKLRIISGLTTLKHELLRLPLAERQARFADYRRGIEQSIEDLFLSLANNTAAPEPSDNSFNVSDEDLNDLMED